MKIALLFCVVVLALVGALSITAQPAETLDALWPAGVIYDGLVPIVVEQVARWRAIPILADATISPANTWADATGHDLGVEWERVYNVGLDNGTRALLLFGRTHDLERILVTVAYEDRAERLPGGYVAWHCLRAALVARADVEAALGD